MTNPSKLYTAILEGDAKSAVALTKDALASGADPMELVTGHMMPAMDEVGHLFETEEYFVPELLLAARAMKASLELIRPLLAAQGAQPVGRVVIGTVKGDLHDIGKNLVASMLEGAGFEVTDLGTDVAPERFVESAKARNADIIALSALLTVTMPSMRNVVDAVKQAGLQGRVKIMVGGAPVTRQYADEIGADAYSEHAAAAVATARKVMAVA
ncbi:MAG TPA: corrinoid protein [Bryobacteraceae bacterium]|nr:corrinoid protein [Bryobacteraceae bacterium]